MVDVAVTNSKLEDRALRMLEDLGGLSRAEGRQWLARSAGSVKLALLMAAADLSRDQAADHLSRSHGQLRAALACLTQDPNGPQ